MSKEIAMEYEEILLGKRKKYSSRFKGENLTQADIRVFADYVFREILGWTPYMARDYFTPEIMENLHLKTILKNINFPQGVSEKDGYYIAYFTYPDIFKTSSKDIIIRSYEAHLNNKPMRNYNNFFVGADGEVNARVIMQHAIRYYLVPPCIEYLYEFFADDKKVEPFMATYDLNIPMRAFYDSPLEYMHNSLDEKQRNEVMYRKILFDQKAEQEIIRNDSDIIRENNQTG